MNDEPDRASGPSDNESGLLDEESGLPDEDPGLPDDAEAVAAMLQLWEDLELRREPASLAYRTLVLLEHFGRLPPGRLARLLSVPSTSLSRVTAKLTQAGLVVGAPAPGDGRVRIVTATPAGRLLLAEMRAERLAGPSPLLPDRAEGEAVRAGLTGLRTALRLLLRDRDGEV